MESSLNLESAAFSEFALAASWFAKNVFAVIAGNNSLSMTEDNSGLVASSAFDVHEIRVRGWDQSFEFVGLPLSLKGGVKKISVHLWLQILLNISNNVQNIVKYIFSSPKPRN